MVRCKIFLIALLFGCAFPAFALQNYRATYHLSIRGVGAGKMVHEAFFTNLTYRIDTVTTPSIVARMLGFGEIRESSQGRLEDSIVLPQYYQRVMLGDEQYDLAYDFLNESHEIQAMINHTSQRLKYDPDVAPLDTLSMVVQSLLDITNQRSIVEYTIISEDDINTYQVEKMSDEKWETKAGKIITVKVYRQKHAGKQTRIYFAEHPLRLVKLEQLKNNESRFALKLLDYQTLE